MFRFFKTILISRLCEIFHKSTYFAKSIYFVFVGKRVIVCEVKDVKFDRKCEELRSQNSCLENAENRKLIFDQQSLMSEDINSCLQQMLVHYV